MFDHLLDGLKAGDKLVRLRCCQLLTLMLNIVESISDEHYELIRKSLSERINDKDAGDCGTDQENALVLAQLAQLLKYDSRSEMRKSIIENLVFSKESISAILERARDVDPAIRKMVYYKIKNESISYKNFSSKQISDLITFGCEDRDETVKSACLEMIYDTWLVDYEKLVQFFHFMSMETEYLNQFLYVEFFKRNPKFKLSAKDFSWDELTMSDLLAIEAYTHLYKNNDDRIEVLIPTLSFWVELIENTYEINEGIVTNEDCQGLLYMFKISQNLDMCDETGRRSMLNLCKILLVNNSLLEENQKICLETMYSLIGNVDEFYRTIVEYLNEISTGIAMDNSILVKALELLSISFEAVQVCYNSPQIAEFIESYAVPNLETRDQTVYHLALKSLLLYSLQCAAFGRTHMDLFLDAIESTKKDVVLLVLKFLFDWILLNGFDFNQEQTPLVSKMLVGYLDHDYSKSVAVEGLCKCLLLKHITDENVLCELIVLYMIPETARFPLVMQCSSYFFDIFTKASLENQVMIQKIFYKVIFALEMKTLEGISISYTRVVSQLLEFTNPKLLLKPVENKCLHLDIAIQGLELAVNESPNFRKIICNMLPKLDLDKSHCDSLIAAASNLKEQCQGDLVCSRALEKYVLIDFRFIQQFSG
ncbi:hypothetical protein HK103_002646 [Boothiomyces macroporosus]|uniref:Nuclear condensin complex subunit 3 C-terminal domain-containing protein n=1 Tax=Boothiomyces macroporosus TaxID=261099 RepID=A0AAD5UME7_9FUNG|nr:hypothetical protein HK103_002646 [Boothiomyces macroporosus]